MSHVVECPLCFKNFSSNFVENHVQKCSGQPEQKKNESPSTKRKRTPSNDEPQSSKRSSPWGKFYKQKNPQFDNDTPALPVKKKPHLIYEPTNKTSEGSSSKIESISNLSKPLAETARPCCLDDYVGQLEVVGEGTSLHKLLKDNTVPSMIFWGPPGCGKTTLAHIIASNAKKSSNSGNTAMRFVKISATNSGKADVQATINVAINEQRMFRRKTILFIDEIHRFNKLQQDTFLPHVENGTIILLGATTENPSFALNSALLSRCRVIVLKKLEPRHVKTLLHRAVKMCFPNFMVISETQNSLSGTEATNSHNIMIHDAALEILSNLCDGDARTALNGLQLAIQTVQCDDNNEKVVTVDLVKDSLQRSHVLYDRNGDQHYEIISALHKSIRGSDDNATLYWLTRMIVGGEDPRYIARRLIRMAGEDIGLADPNAINQAVSCYHTCLYVGKPECDVSLAQCAVYLARAPKSVEIYTALKKAKTCIEEHEGPLPGVPLHLRNASTKLMKNLGYGGGYKYNPDCGDASDQTYLPDELQHVQFFTNEANNFNV